MTTKEYIIIAYGILIIGLVLPFSYAVRMGIFLLLVGLTVMVFLGGGMHWIASLFT